MREAVAIRAFRRSDTKKNVRPGERIQGAREYLRELSRNGLVREVGDVRVPEVKVPLESGPKSSASQAAPASRKKTVRKSSIGEDRGDE